MRLFDISSGKNVSLEEQVETLSGWGFRRREVCMGLFGIFGLFVLSSGKKVSLEEQVETLSGCGIRLNPRIGIEQVLESFSRKEYEKEPFRLLLIALGGTLGREPWSPLSDSVWHLDTECIDGPGSYAHIASRIRALAGEDLPLEDIKDDVDINQGIAWLSFRLDNQTIRWEPKIEQDWIDTKILSDFVRLMERRNAKKRLTYLDLGGQDCLIGCSTEDEFRKLKKLTGLEFEWLR